MNPVGRFALIRHPDTLDRTFARHICSLAHSVLDHPEHAMTDAEARRFVSIVLRTVCDYDDTRESLVAAAKRRHPSGRAL